MNKFIRWQGLLGFVICVVLIAVFWLIVAPFSIQYAIENYGSEMNGAKVEVSDVELSFNPLGVTISGLQVADSEQPMLNALQTDSIFAHLKLVPLVQSKIIVPSMQVSGLSFASQRKTSGALAKKVPEALKKDKTKLAAITQGVQQALPSAAEMLARLPLTTIVAGEALQQGLKTSEANINQAVAGVPNQDTLNQYKQRVAELQQGKVKTLAEYKAKQQQLTDLKETFNADKQAIAQAKQMLKSSRDELSSKYNTLKNAPDADFKAIMSKYQVNGDGAANMSELLFGKDIGDWLRKAQYWQKKVAPYLTHFKQSRADSKIKYARLEGRFVSFPIAHPLPDFWIQDAKLSILLTQGDLNIKLKDVAWQQDITKQPTLLTIEDNALTNMKSLDVSGIFDLRSSPAQYRVDMVASELAIQDYKLGSESMKLEKAQTNVIAKALYNNQDGLNVASYAVFKDAVFVSGAESKYGQMVGKTLASIHTFKIDTFIKGKIDKPQMNIQSDLDKQFKAAAMAQFNAQKEKLEKELKADLQSKLQTYATPYQAKMEALGLKDVSLENARTQIDGLLSSDLAAFKDAQADKAKQAAEDKTKNAAKEKLNKFKF